MNYYELFKQGPSVYIPVLIISLIVTLFAYGTFPLVFAAIRKKPITNRKYKSICYGINFCVLFIFLILNGGVSNGVPYFLWTEVFTRIGVKIIKLKQSKFEPKNSNTAIIEKPSEQVVLTQNMHSNKTSLIITIISALLIPILMVVHILAEQDGVDNDIFYIANDSIAFFVLPSICIISLIIFIRNRNKHSTSSIRYREKCYKKLEKIKYYLDKGIITKEEYEKNKTNILKNLKL